MITVTQPVGARLVANLGRVILGKDDELALLLIAVVAGGHVLMEDVPGVGKTTLARALARSLRLDFGRVQFTPDLMPTDILGSNVLHPQDGTFEFRPGPVFTHILLADEVNRASPRTQSALLEAMSEAQVTSDGVTRRLESPFFVVATQNPVDYEGTYPLPEAQLDRFMMRLQLGYPSRPQELDMLFGQRAGHPLETLEPVASRDDLVRMQSEACGVRVEESVALYVIEIVRRTRRHADLNLGASPRGSLALFRASQASAYLAGRGYATPDDVQSLAPAVLGHRIALRPQARYAGRTDRQIVDEIIEDVSVPT